MSDYVLVLDRPEMRGLKKYGPEMREVKRRAYLHMLKNREGETGLMEFVEDFAHHDLHAVTGAALAEGGVPRLAEAGSLPLL